MHAFSFVSPALVALVASVCPPAFQQKWNPFFDYTNLQPTDEEYWAPLAAAQVPMEAAIKLAGEAEGAPYNLLKAELQDTKDGKVWYLQFFVGDESARPKRVNVQVSTAEPKVLKRVELLALAKDEEEAWSVVQQAEVSAEIAIDLAKRSARGEKDKPIVGDPRLRTLEFVAVATAPRWKAQVMGIEEKKEHLRRYETLINAAEPAVKQKILLDRFPGEPLRAGVPTELENGMFLYDFTIGDGAMVTADSKVTVNYRLFLLDNSKLHDTWQTKLAETFLVREAPLKGITEGLVGMRVGGRRKIAMPYTMGFGEAGNQISPPRAMVVCDVSVEEVVSE